MNTIRIALRDCSYFPPLNLRAYLLLAIIFFGAAKSTLLASDAPREFPLSLSSSDVLATGNEWISLPAIRASDAALMSFNVLSMRDRGLLEAAGNQGSPLLVPYFLVNDEQIPFRDPQWKLIEYWIPTAHLAVNGLEFTITYCAVPGSRGALIHMTVANRSGKDVPIAMGLRTSWGSLNRVTYTEVALRGDRTIAPAPWVDPGETFGFITHDTHFAWSLLHPGATGRISTPPASLSPELEAQKEATLAPGQSAETDFIIGVGVEEFSSAHAAEALRQLVDRKTANGVIAESASWCHSRTRTTGQPDLDLLMNRNYLFTALYAWGRTLDTEQLVGVTSRSPRYYVSAAYWDRDAMLWSFPALLDIDPSLAREALTYSLTTQLRNTGTHSRFIDGIVLEDGFQLDEAVAPILATSDYVQRTSDFAFLQSNRPALLTLRDRLLSRFDQSTGLYSTLQDSQDEYQKQPFSTYSNVLAWRAMLDLASLFEKLQDSDSALDMKHRAESLRASILKHNVSDRAPGASGSIFVCATDGKNPVFADVPPGSLLKLPSLGFVPENDPIFARTYEWLHSPHYKYSYSQQPYGLPGSYRLPFTTSWSVADHLELASGQKQALHILLASKWDGGIVSEGVHPATAIMDYDGRAFATAAGYLAHSICESFCQNRSRDSR
jgi:hypothetical protein